MMLLKENWPYTAKKWEIINPNYPDKKTRYDFAKLIINFWS